MFVFMCAVCENVIERRKYFLRVNLRISEERNCREEKCNIKIRVAVLKLA